MRRTRIPCVHMGDPPAASAVRPACCAIVFTVSDIIYAAQPETVVGYTCQSAPPKLLLDARRLHLLEASMAWPEEDRMVDVEILRCAVGVWAWGPSFWVWGAKLLGFGANLLGFGAKLLGLGAKLLGLGAKLQLATTGPGLSFANASLTKSMSSVARCHVGRTQQPWNSRI